MFASAGARPARTPSQRKSGPGLLLAGAGFALVLAAGLLLWMSEGAAVFADTVFSALAGCF
jgi:hypothetical protein